MNDESELPNTTEFNKALRLRRIMQSHERLQAVTLEDELEREREVEEEDV